MRRLLAVVAASLLLAGCQAPPVYGPSPEPPVEPFFDSEEAALEAVDAFMGEYIVAASTTLRSGGADHGDLERLVSVSQLGDELDAAEGLAAEGTTFVGDLAYFGLEIQQFHQDSAAEASIQAYVCIDYRSSSYLGSDGSPFEGEREWAPFEAMMTSDATAAITLQELRFWTGRDFCEQLS